MQDRFEFRIPMFTDKENFMEFQYIELGEEIECTLCGFNGEPQQCTGFKDKNGKLIFEGDILKDRWGNIKPVKFAYGCFFWGMAEGTYWLGSSDMEVLGNIHENPELLEKQQ